MRELERRAMAAAVVLAAAACGNGAVTYGNGLGDGGSPTPPGAGVGQPCDPAHTCRVGLACMSGTCAPGHASADGAPCVISDECKAGDYCGPARTCTAAGMGMSGASCQSDADCAAGLRCDLVGLSAQCAPEGTHDVGGMCTTGADCFGGLACTGGMCEPLPPSPGGPAPLGIPTWKGETCADDPGPTTAYFHVPRGTNDGDFYRLPFPNDVRLVNGHPSLKGHPSPGSELLGYDVVDRYLRYVESSADGFSAYPTVILRFSAGVSFDSLKSAGAVRYVDVTPSAGLNDMGLGWAATTARNAYVCANWMAVRPQFGVPLTPGHTYAVVIMNQVTDANNQPVQRAADLSAILGAGAPSDAALAPAYAAYKPLRDWAAAKSISLDSILDAAVFTVGHATAIASKIPAAVAAAPPPTASGWVKCGAAPSPCPEATGDRACGTPDPAFDELHALVTLPIFQQGNEPYLTPSDGGDFVTQADGTPMLQRSEQVCMSLTVPKTTMPAGGWPVVVYAHGTGGSFRSQVPEGVAARLASVDDGMGGTVAMAVLGIDQVEHGTRRGSSQASPDNLFYNFGNPAAARGNPLQGAADQVSLVRFATGFDLLAASSPTGAEIKLGKLAFWGHSQGATEGGIVLGYTSGITGAVLSGEGASLVDALVTKKSPVDIADVLPFVLEDRSVDVNHPVLSILQNAIDPADPLNHGATLAANAPMGVPPKHVFQPFGQKDTYAPPVTQQTFALVAGLGVAVPPSSVATPDNLNPSRMPIPVPVSGNLAVGSMALTAVVREYSPTTYDGHFVAYQDPDGIKDVNHFLADAVSGVIPKVGR